MNEEEIKLLPCPFCGSKENDPDGPRYCVYDTYDRLVVCYVCDTEKRGFTKNEAINGWNTRVKNS